jgi:hypothetical protein
MTIQTTLTGSVFDLQHDDIIVITPVGRKAVGHRVLWTSISDKTTKVTFNSGGPLNSEVRIPNDAEITFVRTTLTEAEVEAKKVASVAENINNRVRRATQSDPAKQLILAAIEDHDAKNTDIITSWNLGRIIKAQEDYRIGFFVAKTRDEFIAKGVDADLAAVAGFAAVLFRTQYPHDPWNRSTSVASNLIDDTQRFAREQFIERIGFSTDPVAEQAWFAARLDEAQAIVNAAAAAANVA